MSESKTTVDVATAPHLHGYTVHERIGGGGSGDVWRATRHHEEPREVAIKAMRERGPSNRAEWRTLRDNAGPHVVPVLDLLTDDEGRACLVMPYYPGGTLEAVVRGRGGLTVGETITALAPIASALEALHARSCVHGDVTPSNVLLDVDGRPALADLGAAKTIARGEQAEWASPGFVAPEVLDGDAVTAAADVYALGSVLWFCCTTQAPQMAALRPRLDDVVPGLPPAFVELVTSCLSQTPEARPHAAQVAAALMTAATAQPVPVTTSAIGGPSEAPETLTRRIRADAQSRQQSLSAGSDPRGARRRWRGGAPLRDVTPAARWAGPAALGVVAVGAAMFWPLDTSAGHAKLVAAHTASPAALQKAAGPTSEPAADATASMRPSGDATRPAAPAPPATSQAGLTAEAPSQPVVQGLLDCRATAWNTGREERLAACLAAGSSADRQDRESLRRAGERGLRYASIGYEVKGLTASTATGTAGPDAPREKTVQGPTIALDADITTRPFDIVSGTSRTHMAARTERVHLMLQKGGQGWRIVSWNLS